MVPSPPATTTRASGSRSLRKSVLGSNSTIRKPAKALRSLASISGVIDPALLLIISSLSVSRGGALSADVRLLTSP